MSQDSLEKEPHPEKVEVLGLMEFRMKVAEFCGWTEIKHQFGNPDLALVGQNLKQFGGRGFAYIPDYPNDLNACAEFEHDVLRKNVRLYLAYARKLIEWQGGIDAVFAGPRVRCEAFVEIMEAASVPSGTEKQLVDSSNSNS